MRSVIRVRSLRFTYPGADAATVCGIDFEVARGEIFGFLGPSGAGKSTTQKVLIGLLPEFAGEARVLDRDLRGLAPDYYEEVGVSFEVPNLFQKLTARENLRYFASLYAGATEAPEALLERVGLQADGNVRVGQFSKGMKVRLGFARALLNRPRLLFLDEPTAGLDPVNAQRVKDEIRAAREAGCTVFLTTHDMAAADQLCDRVAFMVDGSLATIDSPRELKLRHGRRSVRVEYRDDGRLYTRDFELAGLGRDAEFAALLREREIETIHTQETSLEQVFIDVTGRSLT
ncbi:MAG: ABC transporter ATP-binding protein [Myxococcota bacterium]|nr:ABC transporter ATP-binding protein [Myxococcota bacterium]